MTVKPETGPLLRGSATHRRTQSDYMATLLDAVTLESWRTVVKNALTRAKTGDAQARAWLANYLVGKPTGEAPTPLTVIVQQLSGHDPLISRLAEPATKRRRYGLSDYDRDADAIKAQVAEELPARIVGES